MDNSQLYRVCYNTLRELSTEQGITASARNEAYGCVFGRDSAITVLKILNVVARQPDVELLSICRKALEALIALQGTHSNFESGEEPGKCVHEYRPDRYEHLLNRDKPWYVYPDKTIKNYDSIDATPLMLIAIHRYWSLTKDNEFLLHSLSAIEAGLQWIMHYGDKDGDHLLEYTLATERKHGGLCVQSWTDSFDCLSTKEGNFPFYPIAAVEVQAIGWLALKLWTDVYRTYSPTFSTELHTFSIAMKKNFNQKFPFQIGNQTYLAQALDGYKNQIATITPNPLVCLWASYNSSVGTECIVNADLIPNLVHRAFQSDLFEADAGLRTMSTLSPTFKPNNDSYHNGSIWPMLNGLVYEGLRQWQFDESAEKLRTATLSSLNHFGTPIELFIKLQNGEFTEYVSPRGKKGCRYQAWTAAAALEMLTV